MSVTEITKILIETTPGAATATTWEFPYAQFGLILVSIIILSCLG